MSTKKNFPLKLALSELFSLDNTDESINSINQITKAYTEVIQAIYNNLTELKLKDGEVFIETLSIKILTTTKSIIALTKEFSLETESKMSQYQFLDFSSINVLTRTIIESFLTLEYLFYNESAPQSLTNSSLPLCECLRLRSILVSFRTQTRCSTRTLAVMSRCEKKGGR